MNEYRVDNDTGALIFKAPKDNSLDEKIEKLEKSIEKLERRISELEKGAKK